MTDELRNLRKMINYPHYNSMLNTLLLKDERVRRENYDRLLSAFARNVAEMDRIMPQYFALLRREPDELIRSMIEDHFIATGLLLACQCDRGGLPRPWEVSDD